MKPKEFAEHYLKRLDIYVDEVINKKRITGTREKQAVERYLRFRNVYDFRIEQLIQRLKFISLINLPLKRQGIKQMVLADWQVFLIANIYCFYHPNTNDRVIQQVVISAGGKIGKTSLTCVLSLVNVLYEESANNNIVITSVTTKQSSAILKYIKDIINYSPAISNLFKILHSNIICKANGATIMIFTNEAKKLQGLNLRSHFSDEFFLTESIDEYDVKDIAFEKMSLQHNSLQFIIGTFGNTINNNLAYNDFYLPCLNILDGLVEADEMFIFFFQIDNLKMAEDSNNWIMANPSLGLLQTKEELEKKFEKLEIFPSAKKTFYREKLNFWDEGISETTFLTDELISNAMKNTEPIPLGSSVVLGLDLSSNTDIYSLAIMATEPNDLSPVGVNFKFNVINFMPNAPNNFVKGDIDLQKWFVKNLTQFKEHGYMPDPVYNPKGYIIPSSLPVLDTDLIYQTILDLSNKYKIEAITYDSYNSGQIVYKLMNEGLNCVIAEQNIKTQNEPLKLIERLIHLDYHNSAHTKTFQLMPDPFVLWQGRNCKLYVDSNENYKLLKRTRKGIPLSIDSYSAILNCCVHWWSVNKDNLSGRGFQLEQFRLLNEQPQKAA